MDCSAIKNYENPQKSFHKAVSALMIAMASSSSESDSESDDELEFSILQKLLASYDPYSNICLLLGARQPRNCINNYVEQTVPTYSEKEFRMHFRISRSLFANLSERFLDSVYYRNLRGDKRLSEKTHILIFLWFAGHAGCCYRDLADRYNLSLSTICVAIHRVTMFLSSLSPQFIVWPTQEQMDESSRFFDRKCFFSKAIGCIDGTHIRIDPPSRGKDDYIDRKGIISICLQAVCNNNRKFVNIFVGYPGSCHDSWVFKNSPLYEKLRSYCKDYYMLGDSAYPCNKYLITPYKDNGHLTSAQKLFNIKLSSGRIAIEHSFGILKQRFRQLYYCKLGGMKKLCHFVRACCVLHNIADEEDLEFTPEVTSGLTEDITIHGEVARGNSVRDPICRDIQLRRNQNV